MLHVCLRSGLRGEHNIGLNIGWVTSVYDPAVNESIEAVTKSMDSGKHEGVDRTCVCVCVLVLCVNVCVRC